MKKMVSAQDLSLEVAKRLWIGYFQDVRTGVRRIRNRIVRSLAVACLPLIVICISGCTQDFRVQRVKAVPTMARSDSAGKPPAQTQERSRRIPREWGAMPTLASSWWIRKPAAGPRRNG
jgi:hypothetical protein